MFGIEKEKKVFCLDEIMRNTVCGEKLMYSLWTCHLNSDKWLAAGILFFSGDLQAHKSW